MITTTGGKSCPTAFIRRTFKYLLALTLTFGSATSFAQSSGNLFRGTWQVQVPEKGALVVLLKSQGLASYFWGDNADRTVYQGNWTHTDTTATVNWKDGSSHRLERTDSGFTASFRESSGERVYSTSAEQLPQEMLGQWAKPPTREDEMRSDRDKAKGFFGIWQLADTDDFLFVEPDRSAASNIGPDGGRRGEWAKQGSELHIIWDSGDYGILRQTERGYNYQQIGPGKVIEDDESAPVKAARTIESKVPSAWYADYQAERETDSEGLAFSSRKVARSFYRGDWLVRRGEKNFERIELARFGGLSTSRDGSLDGQWTMSGQDVFMRWDDGMRKVLSPVGRGFVLYGYRPGRPLDGVPTRILAAAPADAAKLAEHLEGRKEVAKQIREMAEAAGIDPATQEDAGWGRTFTRWVWPFADEDETQSTEAMLAEEFEPESSSDPWWWPFWSETPPENGGEDSDAPAAAPAEAKATPAETGTSEPPSENTEVVPGLDETTDAGNGNDSEGGDASENEGSDSAPKPKGSSTKDWLWPF
jgi:hypothetical protein